MHWSEPNQSVHWVKHRQSTLNARRPPATKVIHPKASAEEGGAARGDGGVHRAYCGDGRAVKCRKLLPGEGKTFKSPKLNSQSSTANTQTNSAVASKFSKGKNKSRPLTLGREILVKHINFCIFFCRIRNQRRPKIRKPVLVLFK